MAETKIEWTATTLPDGSVLPGYVFNSWTGCQKVSPGCDHCYAENWAKRCGLVKWGPGEDRRRTSEGYWRQPYKWDRIARRDGVRRKVFCASLADVFDNQAPVSWRSDLWCLIATTPYLDWLMLTKRPQNIAKMLPETWGNGWSNVWLGTTCENQEEADRRIPHLLYVPAKVHFLSCEPMLGRIHLPAADTYWHQISWVICGGESGHGARPMHQDWVRSLRDQCVNADIAFFFKQHGEWAPESRCKMPQHAIANDGTVYLMSDLAYPDGPRRGEAIRAGHDQAKMHTIYNVGKKNAGAELDGRLWRQFPKTEASNGKG